MVKHVQNPHSMIFENRKKKLKTPIGNLFFIFFIFEKKIPTWKSDFGQKKRALLCPPPSVADEIETSENLKIFSLFQKTPCQVRLTFGKKTFWSGYPIGKGPVFLRKICVFP